MHQYIEIAVKRLFSIAAKFIQNEFNISFHWMIELFIINSIEYTSLS